MKLKLEKVHSPYGAPMGRRESYGDRDYPYRFHLQRVRIDAGGYDDGGAYWGNGEPLWWAKSVENEDDGVAPVTHFIRAKDREAAKGAVRDKYPKARFYR